STGSISAPRRGLYGPRGRQRRQKLLGIDGAVTAAEFKMQLRLADIAGRADTCDDLAARHLLPALDQHLIAMGVGRDPPIGMFDENQITVTAQLVSAIGYYSG